MLITSGTRDMVSPELTISETLMRSGVTIMLRPGLGDWSRITPGSVSVLTTKIKLKLYREVSVGSLARD